MSSLRRPAVLLISGLIALCPASSAFAQSAGDEQYSDPLAGQGSSPAPKPSQPSSGSGQPSLTQQPQGSGSSGSGSSGSGSDSAGTGSAGTSTPAAAAPTAPTAPSVSAAGQLPRTGLDTGTIAVFGAALLLLGIGLRLRTADARF